MTHEEYCRKLKEIDINDLRARAKLREKQIGEEIDEQYPQIIRDCSQALCNIERRVKERKNES